MKKEYLDHLYQTRESIRLDLGMAEEIHDFPADGSAQDVHRERVRRLKEALNLQDENISAYLRVHGAA